MSKIRSVRPEAVTLLASVFLLSFFNLNLWQHLIAITSSDTKGIAMRVAFVVMLFCVFNIYA